jgi:serine/threonine protein kinase
MLSPAVKGILKKKKKKKRSGKTRRCKRDRLQHERAFVKKFCENKEYIDLLSVSDNVSMFQENLAQLLGLIRSMNMVGLKKGRPIGSGISGTVYRCCAPNISDQFDKVMKLMRWNVVNDADTYFDGMCNFMFELRTLLLLEDEDKVVPTLGGFIEQTGDVITCGIVMKRMDTTLRAYLCSVKQLKLSEAATIADELVGLAELTLRTRFVHHDLHMSNILCTSTGTNLCLCDYGQVAAYGANLVDVVPQYKWSDAAMGFNRNRPHYGPKHRTKQADESCDHYSIAVHMLEVLHGRIHTVFRHFLDNEGDVLVDDASSNGVGVSLLVPIRTLLKQCIDGQEQLRIPELKDQLTILKATDEAKSIIVRYEPLPDVIVIS